MTKKTFSASLEQLYPILDFVGKHCEEKGFRPDVINKILVATEEVVVNIFRHGLAKSTEIECLGSVDKPGLRIRIDDDGVPYDPSPLVLKFRGLVNPPFSEEVGGFGVFLYVKLMDEVQYQRKEGLNSLLLIKYLA